MDYNSLVSALQAATELDSSEATAYYDTAIDLAQERLTRDLDVHGFTIYTTVSMASGSAFVARPSAARIIKSVYKIASTGEFTPLFMRTGEFCRDYWPIRTSTSTPLFYADHGFTLFLLCPTPGADGTLEFEVVVRPTAVSSGHLENWFTTYAGNALFYASMVEMLAWMKNATAMKDWDTRYLTELANLTIEAKRNRRDDQAEPLAPQKTNTRAGVANG